MKSREDISPASGVTGRLDTPCESVACVLTCVFHTLLPRRRRYKMEGLSEMTNLEELWLCRNRISEVGHGLPRGTRLRELNLAHNRIGCFKELLKLSSLEGLRGLTLQDPHFGENPVCGLSNYRTYVAHHLTQARCSVLYGCWVS